MSAPARFHLAPSQAWSGCQMKDSKKNGQPTAIRTKMATLMAIARPGRGIQVASRRPRLVIAAP